MNLEHKTILITGASQGIGEAVARAFADYPVNLALLARSEDRITALEARLAELGDALAAPPADPDELRRLGEAYTAADSELNALLEEWEQLQS
jgi:2,3-dihydro-2,3-dihydroxybenzoate dehydrogenase